MRILYGITKSNMGGAQRYVLDLAVAAKKEGHQVSVLCGEEGGILNTRLEKAEIPVFIIPRLGRDISLFDDIRSFFYTCEAIHEWKPDVFHINSSKMGGIGGVAGRVMRVPKVIFTSHGWAFNEPRPDFQKLVIKFFHWLTILLSHITICVSEKTRKDVAGLPFIKHKLAVIKNGIHPFKIMTRDEARATLGIGNEFIVGTLAELHVVKGLDVLLVAWAKAKKPSGTKLFILGAGEEQENLLALAKDLNIAHSVAFKGYVENARTLLPAFDIFVLPSRSENLPYAILEAGFASLPIVATGVGGIPEIVEDNKSGLLVEAENPDALAEALEKLERDKNLRDKLGKNLRHAISSDFSISQMVEKTLDLYSRPRA